MTKLIKIPKCTKCDLEIHPGARACASCGSDVGFPNVRLANSVEEVEALRERVRDAQASAEVRGTKVELENFGREASESRAVLNRKLHAINELFAGQNTAMSTYYKARRAGARLPEHNEWDASRDRVDSTINPHGVHEEIQFAALSLDGRGVKWYGDFGLVFEELKIAERATVFEENPFTFLEKRPLAPKEQVPPGFRASWGRRGELAMAKLHSKIDAGMTVADFPKVLVDSDSTDGESDFIEVHIYGPLHTQSFSEVTALVPENRADKIIWQRVKSSLEKQDIKVSEL